MEEEYLPLNLPFSTADANGIQIEYNHSEQELKLILFDYNNRKIGVIFTTVISFKFEIIEVWLHRNDQIYIVKNSKWLNQQLKGFKNNYPYDDVSSFQHLRFCFNADDEVLDIICHYDFTLES